MMWLLFIVLVAAARGQANDNIDTHLDLAMTGFDAFCVNSFIQPDPGRRNKILQPSQTPTTTFAEDLKVNRFIHEEDAPKCVPDLSVETVINYIDWQKHATSSSFQLPSDLKDGSSAIRYDNSASCGNRNTNRNRDMLQFFKNTGGEVVFVSAECVTRVITIAPFEPLTFTPAFEHSLVNLYKAALNPATRLSHDTFSNFVWAYGTHFSNRTHLGAKIIFGKLFSSRSATPGEQTSRQRCVLESAEEALMPCKRRCEGTLLSRFTRATTDRCLTTEQGVFATITGPLPQESLNNWSLDAEELPDPISIQLEPISTLFEREWTSSHHEVMKINKTILRDFFVSKLEERTYRMLTGWFGQSQLKGCGLNSRCDPGEECLNEPDSQSGHRCKPKDEPKLSAPSPTRPPTKTAAPPSAGRIIIVGGLKGGEIPASPYSIALFGPALPLFPVVVHGSSLSMVGNNVYSCGGYGSSYSFKKCWAVDTLSKVNTWRSFDIPWELGYHSAVVVQDEIWFFLSSTLRIFHTKTLKFSEIQMEFSIGTVTCAVAHGAQTFVIGVGHGKEEVFVNSDSSKPDQWKFFSTLLQGRQTFGCHVFQGEIFVTGGYAEATYSHLSSVEAISIVDGTVRSISPLGGVRADHKMAIVQGRLAVLGGHNGVAGMKTIETYDEQKNVWETLGRTLGDPRYHFGLTQYLP